MSSKPNLKPTCKNPPLAAKVWVEENQLKVKLRDGRLITAPMNWFPGLRLAPEASKKRVEILGMGGAFHWPRLDHDMSTSGLLIRCRKAPKGSCSVTPLKRKKP